MKDNYKTYLTEMLCYNNVSNEYELFAGSEIIASSFEEAEKIAKEFHPYLKIVGEAIVSINYNLN